MSIIICDIDGTLVAGNRPIQKTVDFINEESKMSTVVLITGRPDTDRASTERMLDKIGVHYNMLKMAHNAPTHQLRIAFKKDMAKQLLSHGKITLAIDNDADARNAYASLGIPTKNPRSLPDINKTWNDSAFRFF